MIRVRRYTSQIEADRAASYLRAHGVYALVVNSHIHQAAASMLGNLKFTQLELVVASEAHRAAAEALLEEYDALPPMPDADLDAASAPDLSRLDPRAHPIECPDCAVELPLDAAISACDSCGEPVDIIDLLLHRYGPEALQDCYESTPIPDPPPEMLEQMTQIARERSRPACPHCGHDIADLPARGRCPACGDLFDKDDPVRRR